MVFKDELGNVLDRALKLALKKPVDQAEIFVVRKKVLSIRISNNQVFQGKGNYDSGIGIRLLRNNSLGFSFATGFSEKGITDAIDDSYKIVKVEKNQSSFKNFSSPQKCSMLNGLFDKKLYELESDESIDIANRMIDSALAKQQKKLVFAGSLNVVCCDTAIANSLGIELYDQGTSIDGIAQTTIKEGIEESEGYDEGIARELSKFNPEEIGVRSAQMASSGLNAKSLDHGKYAVVLDSMAASVMIDKIAGLALGSNIQTGLSPFIDKIGENIAIKQFTLYDDATYPGGIQSKRFDDEGTPTQKTTIIENGILKGYLYDLNTAQKENTKSTGNGTRDFDGPRGWAYFTHTFLGLCQIPGRSYSFIPYPSVTNARIEKGDFSREELIEDTKDGIFIGWNHYCAVISKKVGDYMSVCRGGIHKIKDGELQYPIKKLRLHIPLAKMIKNITGIGKNVEQKGTWVWGNSIVPTIRVEKADIVTA